jgi:hypothetical protein
MLGLTLSPSVLCAQRVQTPSSQRSLMFRLLIPVPGILIDPWTPEPRALSVTWNGPSLIDLV